MILQLLRGILLASTAIAALFFTRFYRRTRDRFFLLFAGAFWMLMVNWAGVALMEPQDESRKWVYLVRLFAFVLILAAIIDKNRPRP